MDRSSVDPSNPSDPQRSSNRAIPVDLITNSNPVASTMLSMELKMTRFGTTRKKKRVRDRQRSRGRRVAELSRALSLKQNGFFQSHPGFRTNQSDKVNDQRLSFVYSFAVIYLHTHFSKALILGKFGKVIFCCAKILGYKTHPEF